MLSSLCARPRRGRKAVRTRRLQKDGELWKSGDLPLGGLWTSKAPHLAQAPLEIQDKTAPRQDARIFLRDQRTLRFLSITAHQDAAQCTMTEEPASLFVTHAKDTALGFAHEGLPAFGCFLGYSSFLQNWYASLGAGSDRHLLPCEAENFQAHSEFKWHPDATIKHLSSGLWLFVDPAKPDVVVLDACRKSQWEAIPTASSQLYRQG
mmetsp:Transcript_61942/g.115818  ORF Transcript_61942/g.115818 Transcript_61942/m.115818 type:complete len:207 (-) Transcript_61942:724-1344(-)